MVLKLVCPFLPFGSTTEARGAGSIPAKTTGRVNVTTRQPPFFLAFKGGWVEDRQPRLRGAKPSATFPREAFQHASHSCAPYQTTKSKGGRMSIVAAIISVISAFISGYFAMKHRR